VGIPIGVSTGAGFSPLTLYESVEVEFWVELILNEGPDSPGEPKDLLDDAMVFIDHPLVLSVSVVRWPLL